MKIKCLLIMPGKEVQKVRIPGSMKFIKSLIGKDLFKYKLDDKTILFADNNANAEEFNRMLKGDVIIGTFLVVGINRDKLVSMKRKSIRRYTNMFKLRKHRMKVHYYKMKYLEQYFENKKKAKQEDILQENVNISKLVA